MIAMKNILIFEVQKSSIFIIIIAYINNKRIYIHINI